MRRVHRAAHRKLWPFLAFAVVFGVALALYLRHLPTS
jgi:hypothetical protein